MTPRAAHQVGSAALTEEQRLIHITAVSGMANRFMKARIRLVDIAKAGERNFASDPRGGERAL